METIITLSNAGITQLAREINVDGCEVAVTRLLLPRQHYNVDSGNITFTKGSESIVKHFPAGYYSNVVHVAEMLTDVVNNDGFSFVGEVETMMITIEVKDARNVLTLPTQLATLLKVPKRVRAVVQSSGPVEIHQNFYIHGDFVHPTLFNNSSKQLLYVAHGYESLQFIKQPVYLPVCMAVLNSIRLWTTNEDNKPVNFMTGSPLVQLSFRKMHKY